ncbi:MAG: glutamate 5-kinase [Spirochaetes bacterium]|nr:glutamate 5-kinase [Spirochaetota bacterium]MBN2769725.1 glutamate 5-kinase [Spirochaetota bacterium]
MPRKDYLKSVRRVVVKIGSSSITENGRISEKRIETFVRDIAAVKSRGYEVIVVSSGAISAGAGEAKIALEHLAIPVKQALAAVGQTVLMNSYRHAMQQHGIMAGQILMTEDDVKNRRRFLNLRNTINALLKMNAVPVINENDSVAVQEIKVGDNDTLSVHVAHMAEAQLLILLSDVDGFYRDLSDDEPIDVVHKIDENIRAMAGGSGSRYGTGGMQTKINAADKVIKSGEMMVIASAAEKSVIERIVSGEKLGTLFIHPDDVTMPGRKRWISFNMNEKGSVTVDDGAYRALAEKKKSLLAIGVVSVEGSFSPGDAVSIIHNNRSIGKGVVNYSNEELNKIAGVRSDKIASVLGREYYDEVIHRDNLIVF